MTEKDVYRAAERVLVFVGLVALFRLARWLSDGGGDGQPKSSYWFAIGFVGLIFAGVVLIVALLSSWWRKR